MPTTSFFDSFFSESSKNYFFGRLSNVNTLGNIQTTKLIAGKHYLKIELKTLFITDIRKWLTKYHGVVHSFISVPHLSGDKIEFNVVTTPAKLQDIDSAHIDRVITANIPLLGSLPYHGVNIDIQLGLYSVASSKITKPIIEFFSEMSKVAGVSYLNTALPYAKFLDKGISILSGTDENTVLEIGLSKSFSEIITGYYLVTRAPNDEVDVSSLDVTPDDFRLVYKNGKPFNDYPYLIFQISGSENRTDWFMIPEIKAAYKLLSESIKSKNRENINSALFALETVLKTSGDLLIKDANKIFKRIKKEVEDYTTIFRSTKKVGLFPALEELKVF